MSAACAVQSLATLFPNSSLPPLASFSQNEPKSAPQGQNPPIPSAAIPLDQNSYPPSPIRAAGFSCANSDKTNMNTNLKTLSMIAIVLAGLADQSFSQSTAATNALSGSEFVGSSNNADVVFKSNNIERMRIKANGALDIGTILDGIEVVGQGNAPARRGISTDADSNGHFDFFISSWQSASGMPAFRFKNGITAAGTPATNAANAPDLMTLDVTGSLGIGATNGSGIEILTRGRAPFRRGISTDTDPSGHFDFFINGMQSANGAPAFRFKNGITAAGTPATNAANAPDLMTLDVTGSLGIGATNGSGIEILTRGRAPVRRGISTDTDPNGHFDFFINGWQSANSMPAFRFKNGITAAGTPATNAANAPDLMTLDARGTLRLGKQAVAPTNPHGNSLLQVSGKIACKELIVLDPSKWADHVFDDDYELMSLENLERYYLRHKHLPDVPTETEVKQNGINTAQMEATLLQKVEELTLYVVAQDKRIQKLEAQNEALIPSHRSPRSGK